MRAQFAKNLGKLRRCAGVSQKEAAAAMKVSQALLSHYENGIREPGLDFVCRAADYYKVSTDDLLGHSRHFVPLTEETAPNEFALEAEQSLRDAIDILLDTLNRYYDPKVACYGSIYLADAVYELLRNFISYLPNYTPDWFELPEESFSTGTMSADMNWVRLQFISALRNYVEAGGGLPPMDREKLDKLYGGMVDATIKLLQLTERRITLGTGSYQGRATEGIYHSRWDGDAPSFMLYDSKGES